MSPPFFFGLHEINRRLQIHFRGDGLAGKRQGVKVNLDGRKEVRYVKLVVYIYSRPEITFRFSNKQVSVS